MVKKESCDPTGRGLEVSYWIHSAEVPNGHCPSGVTAVVIKKTIKKIRTLVNQLNKANKPDNGPRGSLKGMDRTRHIERMKQGLVINIPDFDRTIFTR